MGLLKRPWRSLGLVARARKMAVDNIIEAHNLPQGVISQLFRDTALASPAC